MQCEVSPPLFALTVAANPLAVRDSLIEIAAFAMRRGFGAAFGSDLQIVLGEALNNIVEHAYAGAEGKMVVTLTPLPGGMAVHLVDWGQPMPNARLPAGQFPIVQPIERYDQPEGGFGWALICCLARDIAYRRDRDCNILTFSVPLLGD